MVKKNDKKVEKKISKEINKKYKSEEQESITRFGIILFAIIVFVIGIYFFTKLVVKKGETNKNEVTAGEINYNKVIIGNMLNKAEDTYYVFAYKGNSNEAIQYSAIIDTYNQKENSKKTYWADLDNALNERHVALSEDEVNVKTKELKELKIGDFALIKVSNKKIEKIITKVEEAKNELGLNK